MIFKRILFSFLLLIATNMVISATEGSKITITETTTSTQDDFINYTVKSGDTAYSIAASCGISLKELYKYNPEAENGIKAGQILRIPKKIVSYIKHKITAKETLFSVARLYSISTNDITAANKGLDEKNFKSGKEIQIPIFNIPTSIISGATVTTETSTEKNVAPTKTATANPNIEHRVIKGETLYSISKEYGVSIETLLNINNLDKGLKEEEIIQIPRRQIIDNTSYINSNQSAVNTSYSTKQGSVPRIAILLPFAGGSQNMDRNKMLEMYNGFLLAVKELKEQGKSAEIYSFDIGDENNTKKLEGLLETNEMKSMNLIIGGISKKQIDVLSQFSKKTGVKYVIPFDSKNTAVYTIPSVYRMTTSPSSLYTQAIKSFITKYKGQNIIFVSPAGSDNNKKDFTTALQQELTKSGISFSSTSSSSDLASELKKTAKSTGKNVLVPTSSSDSALKQILAVIDNDADKTYTLFGYPEWQIYTNLYNQLYKYDTTIYTIFFLNENQAAVTDINNKYKEWYNKPIINSYPKWAYLGYDMGLFFMSALNKLNENFESKISTFKVSTLQSAIHFEREKETGGYINIGLYFVQFKPNTTIEKTECK